MAYSAREARERLLDELGTAVAQLSLALATLGEAYEILDEQLADALEEQVFRPLQGAYGRARRASSEFAARHGLEVEAAPERSSGAHSADPRVYLGRALEAIERADLAIGELLDSLMPVEVGDRELRDGLAASRELLAPLPARLRGLLRAVGR